MGTALTIHPSDEENPELERLYDLVRQGEQLEREIEAAMLGAASAGVSQRDLAAAMGTSKSSVNRRLSAVDGDDGDDDLGRAIQGERLKLSQIKVAREATRLKVQRDAAAQLEEANALTRIGPLDRSG
jgi:chromosome segregation and condensation protein ScpB